MKKLTFYFLAVLFSLPSLAASTSSTPPAKASEINIELEGGKIINIQRLADISVADFEKFANRKMKMTEKLSFRLGQKKLRDNINPDGTLKNKQLSKMLAAGEYGESGFHIGGFALGLLMGLIGVLIAYLINDEKRKRRRTWAWVGFAVYAVAYISIRIALM